MNETSFNVQEFLAALFEHLRGMWRYRWLAAGVAWALSVLGWVYAYSIPDSYEASAQVYVDTESMLGPVFEGLALRDNLSAQIVAVSHALKTRPNVEAVALNTNLDARAETRDDMERLITSLQEKISVNGDSRTNVFTIAYRDIDRQKAQEVVAAVVDAFVENSLQSGGDDTDLTERALESEILDHEGRLGDAEEALAQFKKNNLGYMPDDRGDYYSRLQTSLASVRKSEERIQLLQERYTELQRQIEGEEPVFGIMPSTPTQSIAGCAQQGQIAQLQTELASLQMDYTDRHPRIVTLTQTIASLTAGCEREIAARRAAGLSQLAAAGETLEANPVYQNLRIQLTDTQVELASLRAQLSSERSGVARLRADVDKIAEVETNLKQLNRDYNVVQDRYQELLKRRETLRSRQRLDPVADSVKFKIMEPPFATLEPVDPNRPVMLVMTLIVAVGAGCAIAFGLNQIKPVFYTRGSVTRITGVPVLGSVSMLLPEAKLRARQRAAVAWVGSYVVLAGTTALAIVFEARASELFRQVLAGVSA